MTDPAIVFHRVSGGYPSREVLRQVSFAVPRGKITALIGPNGCGKTTLLKTACGLLRPASGEVLVCGKGVRSYSRRELARILAVLPQTRETPSLTVERLAAYGRYPHMGWGKSLSREDRRLVDAALEEAGASSLRHRELKALSGGERQRAYIAMALAQDSEALLLDEPTTYLDIGQKVQVMELIRALNARGKTVLAVLHDLDLAFGYCDRVAVLEKGELRAFGAPEEAAEAAAKAFGVKFQRLWLDDRERYLFY